MARLALLADVHANRHALEAVLADAAAAAAVSALVAGDWVGYGAHPNEVVERLAPLAASSVIGDWDLEMLADPRLPTPERPLPEKAAALAWTARVLEPSYHRLLKGLPTERRVELGGRPALVVHGSPAAVDEHLYPDTPRKRFSELAALARRRGATLVVCGHSHRPFVRDAGGCRFVNPGAVGRQSDGDPRAGYALFDPATGEVELRRVAYDAAAAAAAVRRAGLPEPVAAMFEQGRGLKRVLGREGE